MANTPAPLNPEKWKSDVQDYLNAMLVADKIGDLKSLGGFVNSGDVIHWPYINDMRVQSYTPGTDLTIDDFVATDDSLTINRSRAATAYIDPQEVKQAEDKAYPSRLARQAAFVLAQELDQKVLKDGVDNATGSVTGGTFTASNIYSTLTSAMSTLERQNATGEMFVVLDPERVAILAQNEVANGWNVADRALKNGFVGDSQAGFKVYSSNNLYSTVTLTMGTQPTATDTVTILGITFTFVAAIGTTAGNVLRGANAAASQTNLRTLFNTPGTTTTTGVALSLANQRVLQNAQASMGAWATNVSTIVAYSKIGATSSFSATANTFGTETSSFLAGVKGSVKVARQMMPELYIKEEPKQLGANYITHHLYGAAVFTRDKDRLAAITYNV